MVTQIGAVGVSVDRAGDIATWANVSRRDAYCRVLTAGVAVCRVMPEERLELSLGCPDGILNPN